MRLKLVIGFLFLFFFSFRLATASSLVEVEKPSDVIAISPDKSVFIDSGYRIWRNGLNDAVFSLPLEHSDFHFDRNGTDLLSKRTVGDTFEIVLTDTGTGEPKGRRSFDSAIEAFISGKFVVIVEASQVGWYSRESFNATTPPETLIPVDSYSSPQRQEMLFSLINWNQSDSILKSFLSPNEKVLGLLTSFGRVILIDAENGIALHVLKTLEASEGTNYRLEFSPDGTKVMLRRLTSTTDPEEPSIFEVSTGKKYPSLENFKPEMAHSLKFSPTSDRLEARFGGLATKVRRVSWNINTGKTRILPLRHGGSQCSVLSFEGRR